MNSFEDKIIIGEVFTKKEKFEDMCYTVGLTDGEGDFYGEPIVAVNAVLSYNIPPMDINMVFASDSGKVQCYIDMETSSPNELSSDYKEKYTLTNITADNLKKFDEKTIEDISVKIIGRFCEDMVNDRYNRIIECADFHRNPEKDAPEK